jgi:hypothetical protein
MVSIATAISADLTTAIRDFGTGVEARGRTLGSTVRQFVGAVGVNDSFLSRAASAPGASEPTPGPDADDAASDSSHPTTSFVIVDKSLTRC